jgi:hypothetical protein
VDWTVDNLDLDAAKYVFGPSRPIAWLLTAVAVVAAGAVAVSSDPAGRLLLGCVTVVLAVVAGGDLLFWPRLTATAAGVAIFTPSLRTRLAWAEIDSIRVDEHARHGLTNRALEIESGELLVVLSKRCLGRDPREVLEQLTAIRR